MELLMDIDGIGMYRASLHVMQHKAEESWWHVARGAVLRFFEAFLEVRLGTLA